jgi:thiamine-phosphate pyrophosphorylase
MIEGGVDLIQLRGKEQSVKKLVEIATIMHQLTAQAGTPLIVNDYAEVALRVPVDGVHLGQGDEMVAAVRQKVNRALIIGKSTHSFAQAGATPGEGADYIGFGPLFATPTKPDYQPIGLADIRRVHDAVTLPVFCIGGIKLDNLPEVIAAGARRVVIVSGLLQTSEIAAYARAAKQMLLDIKP